MLDNIDYQIDEIKLRYPEPYTMVDRDGRFLMADLLAAKAQALVAVSHLEREIARVESSPWDFNPVARKEST